MGERKATPVRAAERPADVRGALIAAARQELLDQGAAGLSVRAVARRVGVSHQATVHYFRDRAGLLTAVGIHGLHELGERLDAAVGQDPEAGPLQRVVVMGVAYSTFAAEFPALLDVMFSDGLGQAEAADDLQRAQLEVWQQLLDPFQEAAAAGFGRGADAAGLAVAAWAFVHGLATLSRGPIAIVAGDLQMESVVRNLAVAVGVEPAPGPGS